MGDWLAPLFYIHLTSKGQQQGTTTPNSSDSPVQFPTIFHLTMEQGSQALNWLGSIVSLEGQDVVTDGWGKVSGHEGSRQQWQRRDVVSQPCPIDLQL